VTEFGAILRVGVHVPKLRIARSVIAAAMAWAIPPGRSVPSGARAICNWDEDSLTMAVEAARSCAAGASPQSIVLCSTTAPFADRDNAIVLAAALDLPDSIEALNLGASLRAGTSGFINAARGACRTAALLVASDARLTRAGSPQEATYGDGAAALLLGPSSPTALATVLAARSVASDFVDHYRMSGANFDYALEERWVRDELLLRMPNVVAELLAEANIRSDAVRHFAVPTGTATAKRLAEACGLQTARRDERVLAECGDAGVALPLLLLAGALEAAAPGDLIVMIGIGQGVDAVLLRAEAGVREGGPVLADALARKRDESCYVRYLSHRGLLDVDFGMRAERDQRTAHTVAYRKREALSAFKGGRCERCGAVQFPLSRVCVNPDCRASDTQRPHRLADSRGRVKSFTEDWQAFASRPPYLYGNVEFAEGGNLLMEFTDLTSGELKVNDTVRFVYRIKDEDRTRGFRRYFWKATTA